MILHFDDPLETGFRRESDRGSLTIVRWGMKGLERPVRIHRLA